MAKTDDEYKLEDLDQHLVPRLRELLKRRDSAERLAAELPDVYPPEEVIHRPKTKKSKELRVWELIGLHFLFGEQQVHGALLIFDALYRQLLIAQESTGDWGHKGMPLVWMYECYLRMGFPLHAKRHIMLTLCEGAITDEGEISTETSGVYFRLVWRHGIPDSDLKRYAKEAYELWRANQYMYPERLLQELDDKWMTEYPSLQEASAYHANRLYVGKLLSALGEKSGTRLETLAEYILSCMPGCRTKRRQKTHSTDYDVVCSMEGLDLDFRSELGRYFVCECKDWGKPADFTTMAKFCRVLDSTKSRFGILFSKKGISGHGKDRFAAREQLKIFQDRGMVIVVIDKGDLDYVAKGGNFTNLLRSKYEQVRLDLRGTRS